MHDRFLFFNSLPLANKLIEKYRSTRDPQKFLGRQTEAVSQKYVLQMDENVMKVKKSQ